MVAILVLPFLPMKPEYGDNPGLSRTWHQLRSTGALSNALDSKLSGIHTRGYLPHVKQQGASYFVTFRLADSMPQKMLLLFKQQQAEKLRAVDNSNSEARREIDLEFHRQIERYLDRGEGACYLRREDVADSVAEALVYLNDKQYILDDWVIMPNHVHMIIWPMPNHTLSDVLRSRKSRTARQANILLGRTGEVFWQHESYDHWIRNDDEKARIRRYIRNNPVNSGLCAEPEQWRWSSASRFFGPTARI